MRLLSIGVVLLSMLVLALASAARDTNAALQRQVAATQRAFAATLQTRDADALADFLSDEAIVLCGATPLRGRAAILDAWRAVSVRARAPLAWAPDQAEVVDSGTLAYGGGAVLDAAGKPVGRIDTIWRLEAPGRWQLVFERGAPAGACLAGRPRNRSG